MEKIFKEAGKSIRYMDCIPVEEGGWGIERPAKSRPKKAPTQPD